MSEASLRTKTASPAVLRTAGLRLYQRSQTTEPVERQNRSNRLLALHARRAQIRCSRRDRARRTIRQRHRQPKLTPKSAETVSLHRPAAQRVRHIDNLHRTGKNPAEMLQYVPFSEYIWAAAWSFFAEGDPGAEDWVADKATDVLNGRASIVAAAIRRKATTLGLDDARRKNADTCADYLLAKAPYLDYPTALSSGWPVGTGVIEGAVRHVVRDRMDVTGARWGLRGAEAVLKLRALRANGCWADYWPFHLKQERKRVHESRYLDGVLPKAA